MTCRRRSTSGRRHHCSRAHSELVEGYRTARQAWENLAETVAAGHASELADFRSASPPPLFRDWLVHREQAAF